MSESLSFASYWLGKQFTSQPATDRYQQSDGGSSVPAAADHLVN